MKKYSFLLIVLSLLFMSCDSDYPSSPEEVLKKGIEAIHDNDLEKVNLFFNLQTRDDVEKIKMLMEDNYEYLPDRIEIIETEATSVDYNGNEQCSIYAKTTRRDGFEEVYQYTLKKNGNGEWKIFLGWARR
ncbi:MAG: hypothetical protein J6M01_05210 [Prevotella sp.]|nr:hypothetical protein [Prevotella sp.]